MPSNKILQEKKQIVADLAEDFKEAKAIVFTEYRGLTVAQDTELRTAMRKANVRYQVIKNSLSARALADAGIEDVAELMKGPTAIAFSKDDVVDPAKIAKQFADKFDKFIIKGGVMEGKAITLDAVNKLAAIPAREVLYAQLVGGLISPIASFAMILNAMVEKANEAGITEVAALAVAKADTEDAASAEAPAAESAAEAPATEATAEEPATEVTAEEPATEAAAEATAEDTTATDAPAAE